jgi:hypothetical protein
MISEELGTDKVVHKDFPTNLNKLMAWDGSLDKEVTIPIERNDFTLEVKVSAMTDEQQNEYERQCTSVVKGRRGGRNEKEIDESKLIKIYLLHHIVDPDLKDSELQAKFNVDDLTHPQSIVTKIFLPGELQKIARLMLKISGFDNLDDVDELIENLVKG